MFRFCFNSKATQNARFEQMTKQQQLIEQKKQEIQKKLEEKKRKETEQALKKLNPQAAVVVDRRGPSSSSSRNRWRGGYERKRTSDALKDDEVSTLPTNIFSNDGSFLDQFKKITGNMKAPKVPRKCNNDNRKNISSTKNFGELNKVSILEEKMCDKKLTNINDKSSDININEINTTDVSNEEPVKCDKIRSRRWDKSLKSTHREQSKSPPLPSSSLLVQTAFLNNVMAKQPQQIHLPQQQVIPSAVPPLPPLPSSVPPLPCFSQQNSVIPSVCPAPPFITTSSIPPPAPINPGSIPSPSPIMPYSIPSPSPIQPSAIPPPSPLIPHSIPQPLPLPPHEIPSPPPTQSPSQQVTSPKVTHSSLDIPQPPPPGVYIPSSLPSSVNNFSSGDVCPLSPKFHSPSLSVVKYPVPEVQLKIDSQQMPPLPPHHVTVPAENLMSENEKIKKEEEDEEERRDNDEEKNDRKGGEGQADIKNEQHELTADGSCSSLSENKSSLDTIPILIMNDNIKQELCEDTTCNQSAVSNQLENDKMSNADKDINEEKNSISTPGPDNFLTDCKDFIDGFPMAEGSYSTSVVNTTLESGIKREENVQQQDESSQDGESSASRRKKRRSRWAPESEIISTTVLPAVGPIGVVTPISLGAVPVPPPTSTPTINVPGMKGPLISQISRTDPALLQYAIKNFGTVHLSEEDWKKAEDHYKINLLYQDMLKKRRELEKLQAAGKFKYEYDSDEETEGGTWEHKLREKEMLATQLWADELTEAAKGKHHIGDFLPPEELSRFMEKYEALKQGRPPDLSDYKEYKLKEDNIGFQMLQKLGWTEGQGLGSDGSGILDPVNKATVRADNQGLGIERPEDVTVGDDEYDAYRKRMMLAYRFRPNPLNNPRRPYY
ncbi:uncharacterized protein LOC142327664 isoform X2 [Lycorma delicatula]|uniref:uncharacterized protein LOC142327664 isoform X2 n=1 Tax=Lycorma delicatula TaxID=130591 RepID=UPI003F50EA63